MNLEEIEILKQIRSGDKRSFQSIFEKYYKELCAAAIFIVHDADEAEEIVQNLFVKLWEQRKSIIISSSLRAYLYTSVKNGCLNHLAHKKVVKKFQERYAIKDLSENNSFADPYLIDKIQDTINQLPLKCKIIFELNRFKGYKYKEIAQELNISQKTVEAQMGKALAHMHQSLKDHLPLLLAFTII